MGHLNAEHQLILGILMSQGTASSAELRAATGKSQATVSRLLADLSPQVLKIGQARASRYAIGNSIHGRPAQQALWWTDESGSRQEVGRLTFLANNTIDIHSTRFGSFQGPSLPWYLSPLRAEGFLGRLAAKRLAALEVDNDPERWSLETVLYAALQVHDAPGAMTLGLQLTIEPPLKLLPDTLPDSLDKACAEVAQTLPLGSSAGGEQPKFLAIAEGEQHVIVKFTPPLRSPGGMRWADLLVCEHLAARTLQDHGLAAASSELARTGERTYLISQRFDRLGATGRRHVVSIGKAHEGFVQGAYRNWADTASALALAGRLTSEDADAVILAREFGHLIGNTDMHSGNLGLFVEPGDIRRGRFRLAPVYDMLPMRYRPNPLSGGVDDYTPFTPDTSSPRACEMALDFWERVAANDAISGPLRDVAAEMGGRLRPGTLQPGSADRTAG